LTALRVVFVNWLGKNEAVTDLGIVTLKASVEYPAGTFTQIKFNTATSVAMAVGATVESDLAVIAGGIPNGATFWIRTFATSAAQMPLMTVVADPTRGDGYETAASGLTDKTMSGTITAATEAGTLYMPSAIVAFTTQDAYALLGDERLRGKTIPASGDRGEVAPKIGAAGHGYMNMGCPTDTAAAFGTTHNASMGHPAYQPSKRVQLVNKYCNKVVLQYGINDFIAGAPDAYLRNALPSIAKLFPTKKTYVSTIPPYTLSTDGWTTLANQNENYAVEKIVAAAAVANGGSGYVANELITFNTNPDPWWRSVVRVASVIGGAVDKVYVRYPGTINGADPGNPVPQYDGTNYSGSGSTFNLTWAAHHRIKNNHWRRAEWGNLGDYIEVADAVSDARGTLIGVFNDHQGGTKWKAPGYTDDGLNHTLASEAAIAAFVPQTGPPVVNTAPTITGTVAVGNTLNANDGEWTGEPPIKFSRKWKVATLDGGGNPVLDPLGNVLGVARPGATGTSYVVNIGDVEKKLVLDVQAQGSAGGTRKTSAVTIYVPSPSSATIWDANAKSSNESVANNGRTVTWLPVGGGLGWVRSLHTTTSNQKVYLEHVITNVVSNYFIGFGHEDVDPNYFPWGYNTTPSTLFFLVARTFECMDSPDGHNWSLAADPNDGDRVGIAFDTSLSPPKVWFRLNGTGWNQGWINSGAGPQNPATGQGGFRIPFAGPYHAWMGHDGNTGDNLTTNFASGDWVDAAPSGFTQLG
jgi:hypothetical protein